LAAFLLFGGLLPALLLGDRAVGALAFGSAVLVWGAGSVIRGKDHAAEWALVVAAAGAVLGVLGHLISGVGT